MPRTSFTSTSLLPTVGLPVITAWVACVALFGPGLVGSAKAQTAHRAVRSHRISLAKLLRDRTHVVGLGGQRFSYVWSDSNWANKRVAFFREPACRSVTVVAAYEDPGASTSAPDLATVVLFQRSRSKYVNVKRGSVVRVTSALTGSPFEIAVENAPGSVYVTGSALCGESGKTKARSSARKGRVASGARGAEAGLPSAVRKESNVTIGPAFVAHAAVAANPVETAISWAESYLGKGDSYAGWCQMFVYDVYLNAGIDIGPSGGSAYGYWTSHASLQHPGDTNPPRGALVYWGQSKGNASGHVGISLGSGEIISSYSYPQTTADPDAVHEFSIAARDAGGYTYLGWISPPGVNLSSSTVSSATNYLGHIVQWSGDRKSQKTAWLVVNDGGKLRREWISDIPTYWCLKDRGAPGPDVLSSAQLNAMPDETNVWAVCDTPGEAGSGGDGAIATGITEQAGHHGARTFTDYDNATGAGVSVSAGQYVQVACKVYDTSVASGDPDGYWYELVGSPWNGTRYAPANSFMNGDPWNGPYSHNTDFTVPDCGSGSGSSSSAPVSTLANVWLEQEGHHGVETFSNYSNASGEGPSIAPGDYVHVACKVYSPNIASANPDGYWYLIADSPWSGVYYAPANTFMNGDPWNGPYAHNTDFSVPDCSALQTGSVGGSSSGSGAGSGSGSGSGTAPTYTETVGGVTHTWTNYANAGGTEGPSIATGQSVQITCKLQGFTVADGNTWWYTIASSPWSNTYYASADAFYNNGQTSGSLLGTPFFDPNVPTCDSGGGDGSGSSGGSGSGGGAGGGTSPSPTYTETVGGVSHTWTNYTNAGGTEGPSIAAYQSVQISCKVTGFKVTDGNTWWYRIASSPWSDNYYVSADAFYNDGATSGSLQGTPFVDPNVPNC